MSINIYKYLHIGDFSAQFSKLAAGLLTDKYVVPEVIDLGADKMVHMTMSEEKSKDGNDDTYEKYIIAPRMFKQVM